jgi:DNA-binding response OmpR family regulator
MAYKLLIVDDDRDILEIIQKRLVQEGYEVISACDGEEALLKVKEDKPDIILLDLVMPKLDGFEVLKEVKRMREENNDKWRPIIIISAKNEFESVMKCYNLQADFYLKKPCRMEDVLKAVKEMTAKISLSKK